MKKAALALVLTAWAAAGCVELNPFKETEKKAPPPPVKPAVKEAPKPSGPVVTRDQINESNARRMADQLREEMDRDH